LEVLAQRALRRRRALLARADLRLLRLERDHVVDATPVRGAQREHVLARALVQAIADEEVARALALDEPAVAIERELDREQLRAVLHAAGEREALGGVDLVD